MAIQLIVRFKVKEGSVDAFIDTMLGAKSRIASAAGCEAVDVLQSEENPCVIALSERWQTQEAHDVYAEQMRASGALDGLFELLDGAPEADSYQIK